MTSFSNINTIILDMDGLMVDTETYQSQAFFKLMREYNVNLPEEYFVKLVGIAPRENFIMIKKDFGIKEDLEILLNKRKRYYFDIISNVDLKPFDGLREIFDFAEKRRWYRGVGSSSARDEVILVLGLILKSLGIREKPEDFFDSIVTGSDVKNTKPHPEIYLTVAKNLGVVPNSCLVLEDSESGIISAKKAGMVCIGVKNQYTKNHDLSYADIVVNNLLEVVDLLRNDKRGD